MRESRDLRGRARIRSTSPMETPRTPKTPHTPGGSSIAEITPRSHTSCMFLLC